MSRSLYDLVSSTLAPANGVEPYAVWFRDLTRSEQHRFLEGVVVGALFLALTFMALELLEWTANLFCATLKCCCCPRSGRTSKKSASTRSYTNSPVDPPSAPQTLLQ
jgi:hypothetical protein